MCDNKDREQVKVGPHYIGRLRTIRNVFLQRVVDLPSSIYITLWKNQCLHNDKVKTMCINKTCNIIIAKGIHEKY
jgi:hypothetical protein